MAAEAEKAAELLALDLRKKGGANIQSLMAESKNYNLNLKDFKDQEVFEM